MSKFYALYHDESKLELIIENFDPGYITLDKIEENMIYYWNDKIYIATNRKILREQAKVLKTNWLMKTEIRLNEIKELKVKTKY